LQRGGCDSARPEKITQNLNPNHRPKVLKNKKDRKKWTERERDNKQEGQNSACANLKEQKNAAFGHHCDMRHWEKSINLGWIHRNCHSIAQIECGRFP